MHDLSEIITSVTLGAGWNTDSAGGKPPPILGRKEMTVREAKGCIGTQLNVTLSGRDGQKSETINVLNVGFVPLYGPCLITDIGEISLDRVVGFTHFEHQAAA